jgi:hypothetical protein
LQHSGGADAFAEMLKLIDGTSRGLPDPARIPKDRDEPTDVAPTQVVPTDPNASGTATLVNHGLSKHYDAAAVCRCCCVCWHRQTHRSEH